MTNAVDSGISGVAVFPPRSDEQNGAVAVYKKESDIHRLIQPYSPGGWTTDGINRASVPWWIPEMTSETLGDGGG